MIAHGVRRAAERAAAANDEAIGPLVSIHAERAQAGDQRRDPVAFLDAQFRCAADVERAAKRGARRENLQLIDEIRHLIRRDLA